MSTFPSIRALLFSAFQRGNQAVNSNNFIRFLSIALSKIPIGRVRKSVLRADISEQVYARRSEGIAALCRAEAVWKTDGKNARKAVLRTRTRIVFCNDRYIKTLIIRLWIDNANNANIKRSKTALLRALPIKFAVRIFP